MSDLKDLIQFHKDCIFQTRHLMDPSVITLEDLTIKNLEELERLKTEANEPATVEPHTRIDQAITQLAELIEGMDPETMPSYVNAIKLGIEALRRHAKRHQTSFTGMLNPLPGECDV